MKKIFALILMSITVCVNANAEWYKTYFKADELREQEAYYANVYSCSIGRFICWSNEDGVRIECEDGTFHGYTCNSTNIRIGLYKGNELIELIKDASGSIPKGNYNHTYIDESFCFVNGEFVSSYEIGYKIIHHLKYVGSVRIIASRYSDPDFDITIPMNPNIKTYITKEKSLSESTDTVNTKPVMVEIPKTYPIAIENTYKMELPKICPIAIESTYKDVISSNQKSSSYCDYDYYNTSDYK